MDYVARQIKTLETKPWIMDFVIDHKTFQESFHKTFGDSCTQANLVMTNREEIRQLAGKIYCLKYYMIVPIFCFIGILPFFYV